MCTPWGTVEGNERNRGAFRCNQASDGRAPRDQIENRIRNVPETNRERAFINAAKTEAVTRRPVGKSHVFSGNVDKMIVTDDRPSTIFGLWDEEIFDETGKMLDQKVQALIGRLVV